ncbi:MAG: hypothetical protein V3R82_04730 [Candidatus Hydrothermarchaeales archaeon]
MKRVGGTDILMGLIYVLIVPFLFLAMWFYGLPVKGVIGGLVILCFISCVVASTLMKRRNESIYSKLEEGFKRTE